MKYQLYDLEPLYDMSSAYLVVNERDEFDILHKNDLEAGMDIHFEFNGSVSKFLTYADVRGDCEQATYLNMFDNLEALVLEIKMRSLLEA